MDPESEDEESFGVEFAKFILACLQIWAMALCIGIVVLMANGAGQ